MRRRAKQIWADIRHRRHIDLYATTLVALIFAALLLVGADLPESVRWSVLFAAVGFLLLRAAFATHREERFLDRGAYDRDPVNDALRRAKHVWIFAPVGSNFLTDERCDLLRRGPLAHEGGVVRVVVLKQFDPGDPISEQLDALLDYPVQKAADSLRETRARLAAMEKWQVNGTFAYGEIGFNPGFSLVAINPHGAGGFADVEFHGFRNDAVRSRMHIHLTRDDGAWYLYWLDQFEAIWRSART
ncbi:hypothetical protein [Paractinoplanes atraurantiacus]|uniref:Uncharacterized protein n=1 Tax=Paractinoplanes atraurantiacus TaxID=1036182 RepID=A0A285JYU5_9ACTN|nr:hypothetical protein [Actinoplanes atraurantiacus]SNY64251.1 hypothetical protein SAMN05421748_12678 [Actinoplanes atraurantiacus]